MVSDRLCTVCGFEMEEGPRDFNICPSCGTEFGLHDLNASLESLRAAWLASGPTWHSTVLAQPPNWEPLLQLGNLYLNSRVVPSLPGYSYSAEHPVFRARLRRRRIGRSHGIPSMSEGLSPIQLCHATR